MFGAAWHGQHLASLRKDGFARDPELHLAGQDIKAFVGIVMDVARWPRTRSIQPDKSPNRRRPGSRIKQDVILHPGPCDFCSHPMSSVSVMLRGCGTGINL